MMTIVDLVTSMYLSDLSILVNMVNVDRIMNLDIVYLHKNITYT